MSEIKMRMVVTEKSEAKEGMNTLYGPYYHLEVSLEEERVDETVLPMSVRATVHNNIAKEFDKNIKVGDIIDANLYLFRKQRTNNSGGVWYINEAVVTEYNVTKSQL